VLAGYEFEYKKRIELFYGRFGHSGRILIIQQKDGLVGVGV